MKKYYSEKKNFLWEKYDSWIDTKRDDVIYTVTKALVYEI